jgi:hypothetical protein
MIRSFGLGSIFATLVAAQAIQPALANDVIEAAGRYTVKITTAVDYSFGNEKKGTWRGSGFLVDRVRIPAMPPRHTDLMPPGIPG